MSAKNFRNYLLPLTIILIFASCSLSPKTVNLEDIKSGQVCFIYEEGMKWKDVEENFGEPDYSPVPSGERLSQNSRVYRSKFVVFYTDLKKIKVNSKTRYEEVITKLEICEKK